VAVIPNPGAHIFKDGDPNIPKRGHSIAFKVSSDPEISVDSAIFVHDLPKSLHGIEIGVVRWKNG
jgi:hypothetical protein